MSEAAPEERLDLADWRRRVATLYVEVRARAETDPRAAWELWRAERERLYRGHPQSPVPAPERDAFRSRHWPYDERLRWVLPVRPEGTWSQADGIGDVAGQAALAPVVLPSSGPDALSFSRIGTVEVPFPAGSRALSVFWLAGYAGGLFLPFRDATNGIETYGAGRYALDAAKGADLGGDLAGRSLVIDLNFAYQPSCAFDPRWACPLAPPENRLDIRVEAGERLR